MWGNLAPRGCGVPSSSYVTSCAPDFFRDRYEQASELFEFAIAWTNNSEVQAPNSTDPKNGVMERRIDPTLPRNQPHRN
jgi:hypothetical protein